jgi:hypothetical protein
VPQNDGAIGTFRAPGLLAARKFARQCSELPPSAEVFRSESGFYLWTRLVKNVCVVVCGLCVPICGTGSGGSSTYVGAKNLRV